MAHCNWRLGENLKFKTWDAIFGIKLSNDVSQILRGAIMVVMTTKFETKSAINRFVYYEM